MPTAESWDNEATAPILSIQHFCLHDGPGIRSLVFFKGCPLRCRWCQNPESWRRGAELGCKSHLCVACGSCVEVCPVGTSPAGIDRATCRGCFACVQACPTQARVRFGTERSVAEVLDVIRPELDLLRSSGGGVTLTGGEPLLHAAYALSLVHALRAEGIHVAMETCGAHESGQRERAHALLGAVDLVLFDLKLFDPGEHERYCGVGYDRIEEALRGAAARANGAGPPVWPRMPVVPGITTTQDNVLGWASLLIELGLKQVTLLPYHAMGEGKRAWVGLRAAEPLEALSETDLARVRAGFEATGLQCFAPGEEPDTM